MRRSLGRLLSRGATATEAEAPLERPGVLGAHYLEGDEAASRTETEEKRLRAGSDLHCLPERLPAGIS